MTLRLKQFYEVQRPNFCIQQTKSFGFDSEKTTKIDHDSKRFSAFKKMGF
jgi:hypothetical protein